MASGRPSGEEGAPGEEAATSTAADAASLHQVAQELARVQEAVRLQEQRAATALREAVQRLERERDDGVRALREQLEGRIKSVEERMAVVEERLGASAGRGGNEAAAGQSGSVEQLEERMRQLDAAVQRALSEVFPRVETLVTQLEASPASTSAASALEASAAGGSTPGATDEEQQRVKRRIQEVKARGDRARSAPFSPGEALCRAAFDGRLEEARQLLHAGVNVNYTNAHGSSPLISAFCVSYDVHEAIPDVLTLLLDCGADPNAVRPNGRSALHYAVQTDPSARTVALLARRRANVDERDEHGATPLHRAAAIGNEAAVRVLLAAGAKRNLECWGGGWKNKTPCEIAAVHVIWDLLRPKAHSDFIICNSQ